MGQTALDRHQLELALALAATAFGVTEPNPRVGCVIGRLDGQVLGSGATQEAGSAHAEVMAIRTAGQNGHDLHGSTAWVTLEPCAHHGRTPPCCDALIQAGVRRVVVAIGDPFPQVNGAGIERLRAAGVEVEMADIDIAVAARELNIGFFSRMRRGRPWVRMKIAASLDGRTALNNGVSQWITSREARADGHAWRKRASALVTGIGTVREDDPRLDVRMVPTTHQPLRVVVDSRFETPITARILARPGHALIFGARLDDSRVAALAGTGAELVTLNDGTDKVDLVAMVEHLAQRGINELHVEAGHKLNASLMGAGLVDELLVYLAPMLLGTGRDMAALGPLESLAQAKTFQFEDVQRIGTDLRIRARPAGRAVF